MRCSKLTRYNRQIEQLGSEKWFPNVVSRYETYVMHVHTKEGSKDDVEHFFGEYLMNDLQVNKYATRRKLFLLTILFSRLLNKT